MKLKHHLSGITLRSVLIIKRGDVLHRMLSPELIAVEENAATEFRELAHYAITVLTAYDYQTGVRVNLNTEDEIIYIQYEDGSCWGDENYCDFRPPV